MKEKYPAHELYFPGALKGTQGLVCLEEAMREWEALKAENERLKKAIKCNHTPKTRRDGYGGYTCSKCGGYYCE